MGDHLTNLKLCAIARNYLDAEDVDSVEWAISEIERLRTDRDEAREAAKYFSQFVPAGTWDPDPERWPWLEGDDE
jgi:hypothetical protein